MLAKHKKAWTLKCIVRSLGLIFCLLCMAAGAANWGLFGFYIAIPFVFIFIFLLYGVSHWWKILWVLAAVLLCAPLSKDHTKNTWIFPSIGHEFSLSCGWTGLKFRKGYSSHQFFSLYRSTKKTLTADLQKDVVEFAEVPCDYTVTLDSMHFTYPEFEGWFQPVFKDAKGRYFTIYHFSVDQALQEGHLVGAGITANYQLQSRWTRELDGLKFWLAWGLIAGFYLLPALVIGLILLGFVEGFMRKSH